MKLFNRRLLLAVIPVGLLIVAGCTLLETDYSSLVWWSSREDEEDEYDWYKARSTTIRMATTIDVSMNLPLIDVDNIPMLFEIDNFFIRQMAAIGEFTKR